MMKHLLTTLFFITLFTSCNTTKNTISTVTTTANSNSTYWQQHVDYTMSVDVDVDSHTYTGQQQLIYTNNSPDVLKKVFYHLYFNAFQPNSEMDIRSRTITDPDPRVGDRIQKLQPDEIGFIKVNSLTQNGVALNYETVGTILEVNLATPIQPGEKVTFNMDFNAQIPLQIRRSGRDNKEGVALSMTQWYPKLAEYDFEGWHADPYISREFHGVWGNFDVKLTIDKDYIVGGTGYIQNPNTVGHGYETAKIKPSTEDKITWHFKAPNVHDFAWAADPDYIHDTAKVPNGPVLHFFYQNTLSKEKIQYWKKMQPKAVELMKYFSKHIGKYPYKQYSIIQGGDGGMEYAMCTLITGQRNFGSLVGVTAHEMAHTWFQFLLATNEAKHEWMDEGFTCYISDWAMQSIFNESKANPAAKAYDGYHYLVKSGKEQSFTTHADRYVYNQSYGLSAYNKGEVFLAQLGYVIGETHLKNTLKQYFTEWRFKHPTPNDFMRVAEKVSGLELDWYLTDFGQTTNTIDYAVKTIAHKTITLERIGLMPMPIDLEVTYRDGSTQSYYIPLQMMRGEKPTSAAQLKDWAWAYPTYTFEAKKAVKSVQIDPNGLMADIDLKNNTK
jgi:hypothetical protein